MARSALTHPDRVYYPDEGISKRDVRDYYRSVADRLLPHAAGRPLSLVRCPGGIAEGCFFQRHYSESLPDGIKPVTLHEKSGDKAEYLMIEDAGGLEALAQIGALEIHPWGSTVRELEQPERIIFDLDPDAGLDFSDVKAAALTVSALLEAAGLTPFVMLTGGKGLHVIAPLIPEADWKMVKDFARTLARVLAAREPDRFVAEAAKKKREGRIFIDWLRNQRGQTSVCPYSLRARPGAPVATPLRWDELARAGSASAYRLKTISRRLSALNADPWEGYFDSAETLSPAALKILKRA
ncbi:MAG: non-homologous end-joining DNA ligase [Glycocaulis sp.]